MKEKKRLGYAKSSKLGKLIPVNFPKNSCSKENEIEGIIATDKYYQEHLREQKIGISSKIVWTIVSILFVGVMLKIIPIIV